MAWSQFEAAYPDGVVLRPPGGESEAASDDATPESVDYDQSPYEAYLEMDGFGLDAHRGGNSRTWDRSDDITPKTVVLGVTVGADAVGFALPRVKAAGGVVRTTVGDRDVLVVATDDHGPDAFYLPG